MSDLLLITPPFTQLNTPYPGTAYIKGFLNTKDVSSKQVDLGIEVILQLFSRKGLAAVFEEVDETMEMSDNSRRILALKRQYLHHIDGVVRFLQGNDQTMARRLVIEDLLPQASRFEQLDDLDRAFGQMGMQDRAKHLATMFLEDLSDFIVDCVDTHFGFSRYAERLGMSASSFEDLHEELLAAPTYIDEIALDLLEEHIKECDPKLVCLSVPFPGNLYSALRIGRHLKEHHKNIKIAFGGGFANTELRSVSDPRVFDLLDYICLDDGELPLELVIDDVLGKGEGKFKRTFKRIKGEVVYLDDCPRADYKQSQVGTPDYSDLLLDRYISVIEVTNPMHSLWSDGRWLKLTMAHGCYWGKCTFCDTSLDYIRLYEPIAAVTLVDRMEELIEQTGQRGFHFVDEAAPPALMRSVALEILRRGISVSWWTNIRFERSFSRDLCLLLKASGCIAVSGGLEVASDRLLQLIDKGVTVEQVAQVCQHFTEAGVMTHAYLMYGYPTQTVQETMDSLEMVRQLFASGVIRSGFWHQFALTAHSPIGLDPDTYGVIPEQGTISFAENDVQFQDSTGIDHSRFSDGLKKSLYNYMHGIGFDYPLAFWFQDEKVTRTTIAKDYIASCLAAQRPPDSLQAKLVWTGERPTIDQSDSEDTVTLTFHDSTMVDEVSMSLKEWEWLAARLEKARPTAKALDRLSEWKTDRLSTFNDFDRWWSSDEVDTLRAMGLLVV